MPGVWSESVPPVPVVSATASNTGSAAASPRSGTPAHSRTDARQPPARDGLPASSQLDVFPTCAFSIRGVGDAHPWRSVETLARVANRRRDPDQQHAPVGVARIFKIAAALERRSIEEITVDDVTALVAELAAHPNARDRTKDANRARKMPRALRCYSEPSTREKPPVSGGFPRSG